MPSVSELQQTAPHLAEVESFRTMARLHGIPTGTPECVAALPLRLAQDWRLRGNFVELLRELQRKDPEFSLPDALAVLLRAVGGPKASPNRSRMLDEAVDLTASFLASIGGWPGADEEPITDLDHPSALDPRLDPLYAADAQQPHQPSETAPENAVDKDPEPEIEADPAEPATPAGISLGEITQALARLERGSVDLRLHLDSIDQRLSRMEPLLESPALTQPEAPATVPPAPPSTDARSTPRRAEVVIVAPQPAQPAARPLPSADTPLRPSAPPPERDLVHRADLPPAISPTPSTSPASPVRQPDAPNSSLSNAASPASRPLTPRRDRFAAAMELPGTRSALNFPEREQASPVPSPDAPQPATGLHPSPEAQALPPAALPGSFVRPQPDRFAAAPSSRVFLPEVDKTGQESESPFADVASLIMRMSAQSHAIAAQPNPPAPTPTPVADAPSAPTPSTPDTPPAAAAASVATPAQAGLPPIADHTSVAPTPATSPRGTASTTTSRPSPSFTFGGAVPAETPAAATESADATQVDRTSRGPLLLGVVAALLIALAAFLLLRGQPLSFLLDHPKSTASTAIPAPAAPQSDVTRAPVPSLSNDQPGAARSTAPPAIGRNPIVARTPSPARPAPASTDRVLDARQTNQPVAREQILETPTFVPEAVMKTRLLSAPAPLYPKLANAVGLEGGVIFEAIIARDGSVDGLTVLGGQHLLRDAATNAVRQWRYQPFLLHGEPVEVRSIIHVNVAPSPSNDPQ